MVGTPMQRDTKLGTRNVLTEAEYKQVQERFARQAAQDEADFDLDHPAVTPGGDVGGPVSPPPHWLERGKPGYQASLIVDPQDGRMPPLSREAQRGARRRARARAGRGPADSYGIAASTTAVSRAESSGPSFRSSTTTATKSCRRRAAWRSATR